MGSESCPAMHLRAVKFIVRHGRWESKPWLMSLIGLRDFKHSKTVELAFGESLLH